MLVMSLLVALEEGVLWENRKLDNSASFTKEVRKSALDDFPQLGSAAANIVVACLNVKRQNTRIV